jgi:hypothetical protein
MRIGRTKQWCEHTLQSADQKICLSATLGEFLDLRILGDNLSAEKFYFSLQASDIARRFCFHGRGLPRPVGARICTGIAPQVSVLFFWCSLHERNRSGVDDLFFFARCDFDEWH